MLQKNDKTLKSGVVTERHQLFESYWCKMTKLPYIRFYVNCNKFKVAADKRQEPDDAQWL